MQGCYNCNCFFFFFTLNKEDFHHKRGFQQERDPSLSCLSLSFSELMMKMMFEEALVDKKGVGWEVFVEDKRPKE